MSTKIVKSVVENGVAINSIEVDPDNLPQLSPGQTLEDPLVYPYTQPDILEE